MPTKVLKIARLDYQMNSIDNFKVRIVCFFFKLKSTC